VAEINEWVFNLMNDFYIMSINMEIIVDDINFDHFLRANILNMYYNLLTANIWTGIQLPVKVWCRWNFMTFWLSIKIKIISGSGQILYFTYFKVCIISWDILIITIHHCHQGGNPQSPIWFEWIMPNTAGVQTVDKELRICDVNVVMQCSNYSVSTK
jgi:hypothetical protein